MSAQEVFHFTLAAISVLLGLTTFVRGGQPRLDQTRALYAVGTIGAAVGYLMIATGVIVQTPWLIVMNIFPVVSLAFNGLVFRSLRQRVPRFEIATVLLLACLLYPGLLTAAHLFGGYSARFVLAHVVFISLLAWQLVELSRLMMGARSPQLYFILASVGLEFMLVLLRAVSWLGRDVSGVVSILNEPSNAEYLRLMWITVHVATFISTMGYLQERLGMDSTRLSALVAQKNRLLRLVLGSARFRASSLQVSVVLHELTQPMTSLGLNSELLKKGARTEGQRELIDAIGSDVERLRTRLNAVRMLFEVEGADQYRAVNLGMLMQKVVGMSQGPNSVELDAAAGPPLLVMGNPGLLEVAFQNVVSNALRATQSAVTPHVQISLLRQADRAVVICRDNGPGLSEQALVSAREIGFSDQADGTGLGLFLVSHIVEEHQGEFKLTNAEQGGAEATIWLPLGPFRS